MSLFQRPSDLEKLFEAADRDDTATVVKMIKAGADPNLVISFYSSDTPLVTALKRGNIRTVDVLLQNGADPNMNTPLKSLLAAGISEQHKEQGTALLLKAGASATQCDVEGLSPLHHAVLGDSPGVVSQLVEKGVNVDAPFRITGDTPLMVAIRNGFTETASLLIAAGASLEATNFDGDKVRDMVNPGTEEEQLVRNAANIRAAALQEKADKKAAFDQAAARVRRDAQSDRLNRLRAQARRLKPQGMP